MKNSWITTLLLTLVIAPSAAMADGPFDGHWEFQDRNNDGLSYGAELDLEQHGNQVSGTWSDGSTQEVSSGSLRGDARGLRLVVRFCSDGSFGNEPFNCPKFDPQADLFVVEGDKLSWYKKFRERGPNFERYAILQRGPRHRAVKKSKE